MRTKLLHKTLLAVMVAALMCGFAMQASALSLTFTEQTGFDVSSGALKSNDGLTPLNDIKYYQYASAPLPVSGYYNTIAWGRSNNNGVLFGSDPFGPAYNLGNVDTDLSGLRVLGDTGSITVGGGWETISTVYHQNNSINATYYTLTNATIYSELTVGSTDINPIPITFNETLNSGSCAGPGGLGTCPDEWSFNAGGFADVIFTSGGINYNAEFQLANFNNSTLVMNTPLAWSLWTREDATSSVDVQMRITEVPVPEPATLTLLGLGLIGLGLGYARRRSKKS